MTSHLLIPDTQVREGVKLDHIAHANNFIRDRKPDKVILIGDWWDMPSLSGWSKKKEAEGQRYAIDIESGMDAMSMLMYRVPKNTKFYFTEGNHEHRINRYVNDFPVMEGSMSIKDCDVEAFGIKRMPFLKPICLDGIYYCHYFYAKGSGRAYASAKVLLNREHRSCSMGHMQTLDYEMAETTGNKFIRSLIAGAFYTHDEEYKGAAGNNHWRGMIYKENVKAGMYDMREISIHSLKEDYA